MAVCTVDGQQFSIGDDEEIFCAQSCCKPISYAIALDELGRDRVHAHVGREPSGRGFNELTLDENGLPHNPMINSGAIMTSALIKPGWSLADRFDHVMRVWRSLCGDRRVHFDNAVFLSEKDSADRNFALAYMMRENGAFPPETDLLQTLDFYFQQCSITLDVRQMAVLAATYANGGICPTTSKRVLRSETVKDVLSLMYSCGMYDFSGEYAFTVGIPAKSGVSGALFMVVPGVCGFALYSPRLDQLGNSVRGVDFSKKLVETFAFHTYAGMVDDHGLIDPRKPQVEREADEVAYLCNAASKGDVGELRRLVAAGVNPALADYDGRTALHLAAREGQIEAVKYLASICDDVAPRDRHGHVPIDESRREGHDEVSAFLAKPPKDREEPQAKD
jgi:glutaminase